MYKTLLILCLYVLLAGCGTVHTVTGGYSQFGCAPIDPNIVNNYPQTLPIEPVLPVSVDNSKFLPSVGDQGQLGSCTGWGYGYYMRTALAKMQWGLDITDSHNIASPAFLYRISIETLNKTPGTGINAKDSHDMLVRYGCNSMLETPYKWDDYNNWNMQMVDNNRFMIDSYRSVDWNNPVDMKSYLSLGYCLSTSLMLYDDFCNYTTGVYKGSGKWWYADSFNVACHALCIVGYNDNLKAYKIVNSWGPGWGDHGYIWIDYTTFGKMCNVVFVSSCYSPSIPEPIKYGGFGPVLATTTQAYQYKAKNGWQILYIDLGLNQPVLMNSMKLLTSEGNFYSQNYGLWFHRGIIYYYKDNGVQFAGGTQTLELLVIDILGKTYDLKVPFNLIGSVPQIGTKSLTKVNGMNRRVINR